MLLQIWAVIISCSNGRNLKAQVHRILFSCKVFAWYCLWWCLFGGGEFQNNPCFPALFVEWVKLVHPMTNFSQVRCWEVMKSGTTINSVPKASISHDQPVYVIKKILWFYSGEFVVPIVNYFVIVAGLVLSLEWWWDYCLLWRLW